MRLMLLVQIKWSGSSDRSWIHVSVSYEYSIAKGPRRLNQHLGVKAGKRQTRLDVRDVKGLHHLVVRFMKGNLW